MLDDLLLTVLQATRLIELQEVEKLMSKEACQLL